MPHARAAEAVGLALSVQPHVSVGMSDALGRPFGALGTAGLCSDQQKGDASGEGAAGEREAWVQHQEAEPQAGVGERAQGL